MQISGTFEVSLNPLQIHANSGTNNQLGRMSIDKTFAGDLSATSQGEMLSCRTPSGQRLTLEVVPGSATDQLVGLSGSMNIRIEEGQHFYDFDFQLEQDD